MFISDKIKDAKIIFVVGECFILFIRILSGLVPLLHQ